MSPPFRRWMMKVLLDTGVWFRRYHGLPLRKALIRFLEAEATAYCLCPLSVEEIAYKWGRGKLGEVPSPEKWLQHSLLNFELVDLSPEAALKAGLWSWDHGDPVARALAAIAATEDLILVHTDKRLSQFEGFPQRYFPGLH